MSDGFTQALELLEKASVRACAPIQAHSAQATDRRTPKTHTARTGEGLQALLMRLEGEESPDRRTRTTHEIAHTPCARGALAATPDAHPYGCLGPGAGTPCPHGVTLDADMAPRSTEGLERSITEPMIGEGFEEPEVTQ